MLTSLYTAVSGLSANGTALSVIGDNIANVNTTAFKGSRANFADILSASLGGSSALQVGRGSNITSVQKLFGQGTLETTGNPLDMAIDGDGFFIVNEGATGGASFYTRAGQFMINKDGYLTTPDGLFLQGKPIDALGNKGAVGSILLTTAVSNPRATSTATMQVTLDSREGTPSAGWPATWPATSLPTSNAYNYSSSLTLYDSQGNDHLVNIYYVKTAANTWDAHVVWDSNTDPASPASYEESGAIALTFDTSGNLSTPAAPVSVNLTWGGGAVTSPQAVAFDFTNSTQFGSPSATVFQTQNGFTNGSLRALTISKDGVIAGVFTNGQTKDIAEVELAKFTAPSELVKIGKGLFAESSGSGQAVIDAPNTSGRGTITASSLESGNVDLAEEFVRLIAAQRGFQANTKVITTADDLLNELLAAKR
jgi:flagellar hook protein FlgE